jgi:hypothetical protein
MHLHCYLDHSNRGWPLQQDCLTQAHFINVCDYIFQNSLCSRLCLNLPLLWWLWAGHVARMWSRGTQYRLLVGKPEGKRPLGRLGCRWGDNIRMDLERNFVVLWTGLVWLRMGTIAEILWMRSWTFGFHKMLGNYRVASQLVASRVVLISIKCERERDGDSITDRCIFVNHTSLEFPFYCQLNLQTNRREVTWSVPTYSTPTIFNRKPSSHRCDAKGPQVCR